MGQPRIDWPPAEAEGRHMWWTDDQLGTLETAIRSAAGGEPTVLWVDGDPGQGKSSLMRELVDRAKNSEPAFSILDGEGVEDGPIRPQALIHQWQGLLADGSGSGSSGFQAAQDLRELVDRTAQGHPLLIALDDLQWIDRESVESVVWLLRRASGDQLLVAGACRPLHPGVHPQWRRLLLEEGVFRVHLGGLARGEAAALVRATAPDAGHQLIDRMWEHTGGNPLYLRALLSEHDAAELDTLDPLPVPADLARTLHTRLLQLSTEATALLHAVSVLGTSWVPVALAAELADVPDPSAAIDVLVAETLLERRAAGPAGQVRIVHAVYRAAIYDNLLPGGRIELHRRAAELVPARRDVLRHRVAATPRYDSDLADELEAYAEQLHRRGEYREAARHLAWSSGVTTDPAHRERRWLDSLFERLLARDVEVVQQELSEVTWAGDEVRRGLVQGLLLSITRRWTDALRYFDLVSAEAVASTDPRSRYRFKVLQAWTRVVTGADPAGVLPLLQEARAEPVQDQAVFGHFVFTYGQALMAGGSDSDPWSLATAVTVDETPLPTTESFRLAWRGSFFAVAGRPDEAVRDLQEVTRHVRDGIADLNDGVFHALLGYAQWMRGDWDHAQLSIRLAVESRFDDLHPMVLAIRPFVGLATGDYDEARTSLAAARDTLTRAPWPQAVQAATTAAIVLFRLAGSDAERRGLTARLRHDIGDRALEVSGVVSPLWIMHLALAHVWSGELRAAQALADRIDLPGVRPTWPGGAARWIRGLVHERAGDFVQAKSQFDAAVAHGMPELPLHQAFLLEDRARIDAALGNGAVSRTAAADAYRKLGLQLPGTTPEQPDEPRRNQVLAQLTDRERDVVSLLVEGLSYVQIARELFVTRSTVGYHLSNVYAKTHTTSRHQVVDLVRATA
jgi:DNA-binding CsgD family transcriptional regulator